MFSPNFDIELLIMSAIPCCASDSSLLSSSLAIDSASAVKLLSFATKSVSELSSKMSK